VNIRKPLRLWPAVAIAIAQLLVMFLGPIVAPDAPLPVGLIGAVVGGVLILLWWLLFSRARWIERIGAIVLMIVGVLATSLFVHESIAGAGQGMLLYVLSVPYLALALVAWALAARSLADWGRYAALVAAVAVVCVGFALIRTDGVSDTVDQFHWRWTPTSEQRLLAEVNDEPAPLPPAAVAAETAETPSAAAPPANATAAGATAEAARHTRAAPPPATAAAEAAPAAAPATTHAASSRAEWPGFRGPNRDGIVHGVRIKTDWSASPPVEIWRRPIGPGWSSFAVRGDLLYTQEQRGEQEIVGCYRVSTGEPVWRHRDQVRFYESNGGAGPRGTPTIGGTRVYAFGATGILNALDARTGKLVWSRNVSADTKRRVPDWGFASSPLVVDDLVIVAAAGTLAAYDFATGEPRWLGPSYGGSYSSPHLATIDGVTQVLQLGGPGAISVDPSTGAVLWKHEWQPGPIVQPALTGDGDVLVNAITATGGTGTRRLSISRSADGWTIEERWTSNGLKPFFNDFVVHKGHAFGFDGAILASINLEDGKRDWKGGRYGNGQMVLLPEQDLLLVLSEDGELALVSATTDQYKEFARVPALNGKTWNHPVIVGDVLLIRNGEEMAAFRLAIEPPNTLSH
jgi:outer membrane protein assembly factor BamB